MIKFLASLGGGLLFGTNILALYVVSKGDKYPELSKVFSGLGLALIGFAVAF